jgi:ribosomal protein S18 acetylase RimI-like enzyme
VMRKGVGDDGFGQADQDIVGVLGKFLKGVCPIPHKRRFPEKRDGETQQYLNQSEQQFVDDDIPRNVIFFFNSFFCERRIHRDTKVLSYYAVFPYDSSVVYVVYNDGMDYVFQFRDKIPSDDGWITAVAKKFWGSVEIVSKEHTYNILDIPTVMGTIDTKPMGFASYVKVGDACEIVAIYSGLENQGLGTTLIERVKEIAKKDGCHRVWLMTTNDNTHALRFYQKRGFVISAVHIDVMEEQRKRKPIPLLGNDQIPIRDEIELSMIV